MERSMRSCVVLGGSLALSFNGFDAHFAGSLTLAKIKNYVQRIYCTVPVRGTVYCMRIAVAPARRVNFWRNVFVYDTANNVKHISIYIIKYCVLYDV